MSQDTVRHKPFISVIIPTNKNPTASHIARAVASVRQQTYSNWECIVVADGPYHVVRYPFAPGVWHVKTDHPNSGSSAARNRGLEVAKGDIICYLDDGSVYLPTALEAISHLPEQAFWGASYCNIRCEWYGSPADPAPMRMLWHCTAEEGPPRRSSILKLIHRLNTSVLFHRPLIGMSAHTWPDNFPGQEDTVFSCLLAQQFSDDHDFWCCPLVTAETTHRFGADAGQWGRRSYAQQMEHLSWHMQHFYEEQTQSSAATLTRLMHEMEAAHALGQDFGYDWMHGKAPADWMLIGSTS